MSLKIHGLRLSFLLMITFVASLFFWIRIVSTKIYPRYSFCGPELCSTWEIGEFKFTKMCLMFQRSVLMRVKFTNLTILMNALSSYPSYKSTVVNWLSQSDPLLLVKVQVLNFRVDFIATREIHHFHQCQENHTFRLPSLRVDFKILE